MQAMFEKVAPCYVQRRTQRKFKYPNERARWAGAIAASFCFSCRPAFALAVRRHALQRGYLEMSSLDKPVQTGCHDQKVNATRTSPKRTGLEGCFAAMPRERGSRALPDGSSPTSSMSGRARPTLPYRPETWVTFVRRHGYHILRSSSGAKGVI